MVLSNGFFSSCAAVGGFILIRRNFTYPAKNAVNEFLAGEVVDNPIDIKRLHPRTYGYPLVNSHSSRTGKIHHAINGSIHYFYGHFQ